MAAEGKVQRHAINYARKLGMKVRRNVFRPGAEQAWPDVEFFAPRGKVFLIEFKAPGGKLSKLQTYRIKELRDLDHGVYVCDDIDEAKRIIDSYR